MFTNKRTSAPNHPEKGTRHSKIKRRIAYLPPATKRQGKVFTPVCDSVHRRVSVQGRSLSGGLSVQGVSVQEGSLSRGVSVRGGVCPGGLCLRGGLCQGDRSLPPYGYMRAVLILLECILVLPFECFHVITCY